MLVLSRKVGEQILIGDRIVVTVVRIGPKAVRIGVEAPAGVPIARSDRPAITPSEPEPPESSRRQPAPQPYDGTH
jgi:carbon storage regulator